VLLVKQLAHHLLLKMSNIKQYKVYADCVFRSLGMGYHYYALHLDIHFVSSFVFVIRLSKPYLFHPLSGNCLKFL